MGNPREQDFRCSHCFGRHYVEVVVKRPDGRDYKTEFFSCVRCGVMFRDPEKFSGLGMPGGLRKLIRRETEVENRVFDATTAPWPERRVPVEYFYFEYRDRRTKRRKRTRIRMILQDGIECLPEPVPLLDTRHIEYLEPDNPDAEEYLAFKAAHPEYDWFDFVGPPKP